MIRIWNYNKSRIYWERGVKTLQIFVENKIVTYFKIIYKQIFHGIIRKSSSGNSQYYKNCELIMLTNDINILKNIEKNDWINNYL